MKRPLLPYEHQLVEALGVSEEDYLDFLAVTRDYSKSPEEIFEKPQAGVAEVALILTIVGMVFQVAAALLAPTPKEQMQRRNREQRFSPRYGFNSAQELAQYGDPINLVYCNTKQNRRGAVRVSTSLVWSSVKAYGSSQFMQLLLVLGASEIKRIDFERTAFGQLPLGQFSGANTWLYYNENGAPVFNDKELGDGRDPSRDGASDSAKVCRIIDGGRRLDGYSQTFTPSSLTSVGIYDPVPINIEIQERESDGKSDWASNGIIIQGASWRAGSNNRYDIGERLTVVFQKAVEKDKETAEETAKNLRYQAVDSLDQAATYMLGAAEFKLVSVSDETNLDKNQVEAVFECVTPGRPPSTPYNELRAGGDEDKDAEGADDNFYAKCLVKADYAAYQTVTECDIANFSLRCRLFRRIQGRQKKYGEKDAPKGYKLSDNGIQGRMAFFKVEYRKVGASAYDLVPTVFAVRRAADQDNFIALSFKANSPGKYEFRFRPIGDIAAELASNGQKQFAFIENSGKKAKVTLTGGDEFKWTGSLVAAANALEDRGPVNTNEWDLFSNKSDTDTQFSFDSGPEFKITAVTEQQLGNTNGKYADMSTMAIGVYSGKGVQDLRSITAYVTEGKASWIVRDNGTYEKSNESTSYAPDIFADTILDTSNGIGKYAKPKGVDWDTLALSKKFCRNNGLLDGQRDIPLFMDGVIAEPSSWRQFWAEVAPYSLLELARVGGRDTLIPAIPCRDNGRVDRTVSISALFTAGNILEGSYKEEFIDYGDATQDLIATIIYRDTEIEDVFPRDASVQVSLRGSREDVAIRQTFDISQFVSNRDQAILYGKLLCNQRRWIRKGVEFKTFPTDSPISPGAYIYVDVGLVRWQRTSSGIIGDNGTLNAPLSDRIANGSYSILLYRSGGKVVSLSSVNITGADTGNPRSNQLRDYEGHMFVLGVETNKKRVFRATEVSMDEEGEVTVKAVEHPCEDVGGQLLSHIANFDDELFRVV